MLYGKRRKSVGRNFYFDITLWVTDSTFNGGNSISHKYEINLSKNLQFLIHEENLPFIFEFDISIISADRSTWIPPLH